MIGGVNLLAVPIHDGATAVGVFADAGVSAGLNVVRAMGRVTSRKSGTLGGWVVNGERVG